MSLSIRFAYFMLPATVALGCSATSPLGDPSGGSSTSSSASNGGSCGSLLASDLDGSCSVDSDCVVAPPGGNTCAPCGDPQAFWCTTSAVNGKTAAAYLAQIAATQEQMQKANASGEFCASSCPVDLRVACVSGKCADVVP